MITSEQYSQAEAMVRFINKTVRDGDLTLLELEKLCGRFGMSKRKGNEAFRYRYGVSLTAYIREMRFAYVCELLSSDLLVKEIAYHLRYRKPCLLSRDFTRAMGISPRVYRKKLETGNVMKLKLADLGQRA
ncbi:MAG: AraC family transcriptional regulator [Bacteroidota bacterium]